MDKIKGHTYVIMGGTNTGVYTFKDGSTLLIDPGHSKARGKRIISMLEKEKLRTRYNFTTHEHLDHFESYFPIEEMNPAAELYCHEYAKPFIENFYVGNFIMYSAAPNKMLGEIAKPFKKYIKRLNPVQSGYTTINDKKFKIESVPGHSMGSSYILTEDKTIFTGDAIFDRRILDKYKIPFIVDVENFLLSLDKILEEDFETCVIAHARQLFTKEEIEKLVIDNKNHINQIEEDIYDLLSTPYTREDILSDIMQLYDVEVNTEIYHYNNCTIGSLLTKLIHEKNLNYSLENGKILYYR